MAEITGSYNTETGAFTVSVDGKEIPNVTNFMISAPAFYDNDADDSEYSYGPAVRCNITTVEQEGDLKKYSNYSNATEKSKADVSVNIGKINIPGFIKEVKNEISRSIAEFFAR